MGRQQKDEAVRATLDARGLTGKPFFLNKVLSIPTTRVSAIVLRRHRHDRKHLLLHGTVPTTVIQEDVITREEAEAEAAVCSLTTAETQVLIIVIVPPPSRILRVTAEQRRPIPPIVNV